MKTRNTITSLFLLLTAIVFNACVSDGDETISLEYGNPAKMIVGRWKLEKSYLVYGNVTTEEESNGNVWYEFYSNGTYISSDDETPKRWRLGNTSDNEPYYGDIYLDDECYEIVSLGGDKDWKKGRWILGHDEGGSKTRYWELGKTDGTDEDEPEVPGGATGGRGKLVSRIEVGSFSYEKEVVIQTIEFQYDDNNRVISAAYYGEEEDVTGPMGCQLFYNIDTKNKERMTISARRALTDDKPINLNGVSADKGPYGLINRQGYLVYDCFENSQEELNSGDYFSNWYTYNSKGELIERKWGTGKTATDSFTYEWENGNLTNGCQDDTEIYYGGNVENKANIDLNRLFTDEAFDEDIFGLALCGYKGVKDKNLIVQIVSIGNYYGAQKKFDYEFDEEGYPTLIRAWDIEHRHPYDFPADFVEYRITYTK